jgi:acetyl-CoA acyltransferase
MRDAVVVAAVRAPIGRRNGSLRDVHPVDLSALVLRELVARTGVAPELVDDVIWGCVGQLGDQAANIGRNAVLAAGWPDSVPGTTIDRRCGSSQQALHFAAAGVISGQYDIAVAGGVESMTRVPMGSAKTFEGTPFGQTVFDRYGVTGFSQGTGAELVAQKWGQSRAELDEYALRSHERAAAAIDSGRFAGQLVAVPERLDVDEAVRRDTSLAKLAALKPSFRPDGVIHAGNASQISDGCAALLVTTSELAARHGLRPLVRIRTAVVTGADPVMMLTAPIPATDLALRRAGLRLDEIDAFEVNEAFACVPLAWLAETGADPERVNPLGGAIAVGHPIGASGAILATRLIHHLRDNGLRYGLQTMCEAGGLANATVFETL